MSKNNYSNILISFNNFELFVSRKKAKSTNFSSWKISFKVDNHELYKFQIKTPSYDKFIKTLLRIYGGDLFTSYVSISEATIGKYFFGSMGEIEKMLDYLQQVGILTYQKQKSIPQLTFLTARQDVKYLTINVVEMQRRKKKDLEKVDD